MFIQKEKIKEVCVSSYIMACRVIWYFLGEYCIAGNFHGAHISQMVTLYLFHGFNFHGCVHSWPLCTVQSRLFQFTGLISQFICETMKCGPLKN